MCVDWWSTAGIAHLEGLQVLSNMSQNNVRDVLSQFDRETRRSVETHLANIEASFDLGYLQAEDGQTQLCFTVCNLLFFLEFFTDFFSSAGCAFHISNLKCRVGRVSLLPSVGWQNEYQPLGWVVIKWRWWMWMTAAFATPWWQHHKYRHGIIIIIIIFFIIIIIIIIRPGWHWTLLTITVWHRCTLKC